MAEKEEVSFSFFAKPEKVADHLEALATGLRKGSVTLSHGDSELQLDTEEAIDVDIEATRKGTRHKLCLEFRWRIRPDIVGEFAILSESSDAEEE